MRFTVWIPFLCFVSCVFGASILNVARSRREKECYGTNNRLSISGTSDYHYESLRRRYSGCTYIIGNLEINSLDNTNVTYDFGFLSTIKVVTGYVLLVDLNVEIIPLTSLRLIRADNTFPVNGVESSLLVALNFRGETNVTFGLRELLMPALREITRGKALFYHNPLLCHLDSIDWNLIAKDGFEIKGNRTTQHCGECSSECADQNDVRRCWGTHRDMCQEVPKVVCHKKCNGRCYKEGVHGCCHSTCAVGCQGETETECEMCKFFRFGHACLKMCPQNSYPLAGECIDY